MITINGKEYRNLQEQVLENMDQIESLQNKEADTLLATGITAGQVLTADGNGGTEWASGGSSEAVQAPNTLTSGCVVIGTTGGDRNVATLATGTLGYVLTQGSGAPVWAAPSVEGTSVKSTGQTSGKVLTADGSGGASWAAGSADVEGADVKSTGVSSGYVLGADGDGTSSWQLAATGNVSASGTLSVGSVIVGLGTKTVQALSGTNGKVLTWNNGASWEDVEVEGTDVQSTGATSGYVLTADGSGGASWAAGGGSGDVTASGTLSVGSVIVGLGTKTVQASSGTNGKILGWNNGAAWLDPGIEYEVLG